MICGRWEVAKSYLITLMGKNNPKCNIVLGWKIVIILLLRRLHFSYFSKDFCYCTLENRIFSKEFDFPFEKSQVISTLTLIPFSIEIHWTRENVWGEIKKNQFAEACVCFSAMTTCLRKAQIIKKRNDELKIRSRLLLAFQGWTFYKTGSFFCFMRHVWFVQELAKYVNTNAKTSAFYYISGPPYHDGSSIIKLRKKYQSHVGRFP